MKIYFTTDENGYLTGWSSTPSNIDSEISLEVDKEHEVLRNPFIFKYVDGELIKDTDKQQELIEQANQPTLEDYVLDLEFRLALVELGVF